MEYGNLLRLSKLLILLSLILLGVQVLYTCYPGVVSKREVLQSKQERIVLTVTTFKSLELPPSSSHPDHGAITDTSLGSAMAQLIQDRNALPNYFLNTWQNKSDYRDTTMTFVHYPKAGGTTMKDCLNTIAPKGGRSAPVLVAFNNVAETKAQILNGELETTDIFMGTFSFSICEYLHPKHCAYFTMLREPYERMVSHYYFCKDGGESNAQCQKPIEDFAVKVGSVFLHQLTSPNECVHMNKSKWFCKERKLRFDDFVKGNSTKYEMILGYLERKLEDMFAVVGIREEYDVSLGLFQEALGLPFYDECMMKHANSKINATDQRSVERNNAKKLLMKNQNVRRALAADIRLYRKVKEIFREQKANSKNRMWVKLKTI